MKATTGGRAYVECTNCFRNLCKETTVDIVIMLVVFMILSKSIRIGSHCVPGLLPYNVNSVEKAEFCS